MGYTPAPTEPLGPRRLDHAARGARLEVLPPVGSARSPPPAHALPVVAGRVPAQESAGRPGEGSANRDRESASGALEATDGSLHGLLLPGHQGRGRAGHRPSRARITAATIAGAKTRAMSTTGTPGGASRPHPRPARAVPGDERPGAFAAPPLTVRLPKSGIADRALTQPLGRGQLGCFRLGVPCRRTRYLQSDQRDTLIRLATPV